MTFSSATVASVTSITVEKDIFEYAQAVLGNETPMTIESFKHPNCQRDVVDFILVQRALKLGGLSVEFTFELGNYDARNLKLLNEGLLLVSFDTIWLEDAKQYADNVFISDPLIRENEYFAGVFASPKHITTLQNKISNDFSNVSIVTSSAWHADWKTINALTPKELIDESDWIVMAKMVSRGWVDIMLVPFTSNPPYQYQGDGYLIQAIPNIKVALKDSRHFVVAKQHPLGKTTFEALQSGLKILRQTSFIEKAYTECGFLNDQVDAWRVISH
ncbi:hypothetical protein PALB_26590 [Pseudoalteromonas luteoviolacea B = ATCC 29581]|nr:hypothetical protein PALB_26590 [Pseudoalteromonas luteoviolacea B = ATCC 29581]